MPRLSDLIEAKRGALGNARVELLLAEAHLNGIVTALAARAPEFSRNDPATRAKLTASVRRVDDARRAIDEARFASVGVWTVNGIDLCANDPDDMRDALLTALERNHSGDGEPDFTAPTHAADLARTDSALVTRSHERGAELAKVA